MNPRKVDIDPERLDECWQEQPRLMEDACLELAEAKRRLADAKRLLDLKEATLSLNIRKNSGDYGLDKATETAVASTVVVQDDYQESVKLLNEAKYDADVREALVNALVDRRKALEDNVALHGMGYFSVPKENKSPFKSKVKVRERNG